jgi:hypothetical protein
MRTGTSPHWSLRSASSPPVVNQVGSLVKPLGLSKVWSRQQTEWGGLPAPDFELSTGSLNGSAVTGNEP